MKLNHYIAVAGITSRRKAVDLIKEGSVTVSGKVVKEPGYEVKKTDHIKVNGKLIMPEKKKVYILLNKPIGYVTTLKDERGRPTVMDLIPRNIKERIYPVGRLDYNTSGLLLLTNDGDMAYALSHPRSCIKKSYHVTLDGSIPEFVIDRIKKGVKLSDGKVDVDYIAYWSDRHRNQLKIILHSGKYRIVRRLFNYLGYTVKSLDRFGYAGLTKKNLCKGEVRALTEKEIDMLKKTGGNTGGKRENK